MSCTPLPKAAKPVWATQLTRLPCLEVYVKFQFVYTTNRINAILVLYPIAISIFYYCGRLGSSYCGLKTAGSNQLVW